MKRLILQLKPEDHEWLKSHATSKNVSMSQVVRDLIATAREKDERKKSPRQY
jgi:hypothetical protein